MPPEPLIILAGMLLCGAIGYLGAWTRYRRQARRTMIDSWAAARIFYQRRNRQQP